MLQRKKLELSSIKPVLSAKWSTPVLIEGYTPFPKRLLRCMRDIFTGQDGMSQLAVILAIADYARPDLSRGPSVEFLAFTAGMEIEEFKRHLDAIEEKGWITSSGSDDSLTIKMQGLFKLIIEKTPEDVQEMEDDPW